LYGQLVLHEASAGGDLEVDIHAVDENRAGRVVLDDRLGDGIAEHRHVRQWRGPDSRRSGRAAQKRSDGNHRGREPGRASIGRF
jgi:hypothetical protein